MLGDPNSARNYLAQGLALDSSHQELNYQMADLLLQQGNLEASLSYWEKLPPDHLAGNYGQGVTRVRLGQLSRAKELLESVISLRADHTQAHYQLALLYRRLGDSEKSDQMFKRFRELEALERDRRKTQAKKEIVRKP